MPYNIPWDETTPVGSTTPASSLDTIIQELKEAISERITDVIPDWDNDAVDPKTISGGGIDVPQGTYASRPASPSGDSLFYATDRDQLYIWTGAAWEAITIYVSAEANLPATPESPGDVFIASDTGVVYYNDGGAWEQAGVETDTFANRSANPTGPNHLFFASDREQLFMPSGTDWKAVSPYVDVKANRPASPEGAGDLFIANDEHSVWMNDGAGAWELLVPSTYAALVYRNTNQTIANDTATRIAWETVQAEYHSTSMFDALTDDEVLVAPVDGLYLFVLNVFWDDDTGNATLGIRQASIIGKNGTVVARAQSQLGTQVGTNPGNLGDYAITNLTTDRAYDADTVTITELADIVGTLITDLQKILYTGTHSLVAVADLNAGDKMSAQVYQQSGGSLDIIGLTNTNWTSMFMGLIAPVAV